MKTKHILIALAMVAALTAVSCKNNKKAQSPALTQEDVQEQKQALADNVLAEIDEYFEEYIKYSNDADFFDLIKLTDEEKLVKPDYLLDPSEVSTLVTKEQKTNALAIYILERDVRALYDMPTEDVEEVIAELVTELNYPIGIKSSASDKLASDYLREHYDAFRERGEVSYFWKFTNAFLRETDYLLAKNPELFLSKISDESYQSWDEQWQCFYRAIWKLAPYDKEVNLLFQTLEFKTYEEYVGGHTDFDSKENLINTYKSGKYQTIEKRNDLLK